MLRTFHVTGVVQGVGFRPFVYQLATRAALRGWVANTSAGVDIQVEGDPHTLDNFARQLVNDKPPLARIDSLTFFDTPANGHALFETFEIRASVAQGGAFQPISPDVAICDDCLRELFDPADRRYRYPFINCTNCGPRFTIIQDIPYDRPQTTMRAFEMCDDCAREYHDPLNRRFHAQPIACPKCGPQVWLEYSERLSVNAKQLAVRSTPAAGARLHSLQTAAILQTQQLLAQGKIVAVKGLGGFHLACDATNADAVQRLRARKRRVEKPFALMLRDMTTIEQHCFVNDAERALLQSRERPIVLLKRRPESNIARQVAPQQETLGVMLPYTPLHYLLMADGGWRDKLREASDAMPAALVFTSGNLSEEPIAYTNDDARERLANLADAFLMHDRDIQIRTDDSVVRVIHPSPPTPLPLGEGRRGEGVYPLRRSRGYAPFPAHLPFDVPPILAVGGELKNTFCVTRERYAFLSHHIGDLENYETLRSFEQGIAHFEKLFRLAPQVLAYDLHPNYLATRYALERAARENLRAVGVQHHHAHIAACMAENGLDGTRPVIGVAFDGTGYGDDGAIWGSEFLIADYARKIRAAHLAYVPLPGGDKATREPWRIALAYLQRAGVAWSDDLAPVRAANENARRVVRQQIERGINAPLTSSMGRLFDAVASLIGIRQTVNYEAQAAIELEALVEEKETGVYAWETGDWRLEIDSSSLIRAIVADVRGGVSIPILAARFHNSIALMTRNVCCQLRAEFGLNEIALSGGVWQNMTLLQKTLALLHDENFVVYIHRLVPANDGGIALGQAVIAAHNAPNPSNAPN
jgi:hydrogenase maturation protein HypF